MGGCGCGWVWVLGVGVGVGVGVDVGVGVGEGGGVWWRGCGCGVGVDDSKTVVFGNIWSPGDGDPQLTKLIKLHPNVTDNSRTVVSSKIRISGWGPANNEAEQAATQCCERLQYGGLR